jgi:exopolysaccharide biosynthesis polyprenyl glycosylphosphotransferase
MSASVAIEQLYDALDPRTMEILERRRAAGAVRRRGWLVRRALLAADVIALVGAFVVAQAVYVAGGHGNPGHLNEFTEVVTFMLSLPAFVVGAKLYGLYDGDEERTDHSTADDFARLFHLITVCTFLLYAASRLTRLFNPEFGKLFLFWVIAIAGAVTFRAIARAFCRRQIHYLQNTLIIGAGDMGQALARKLLSHPEYGLNLVGFVDSNPKTRGRGLEHLTLLGDLTDLGQVVELLDVERVIVAFTNDGHEELLAEIANLRNQGVQVDILPRLFENLGPSISLHAIEGIPLIGLPPTRLPLSSLVIKRGLDILASASLLIALSPLLLVVAVVVKLDSPGPVFYRHGRVGRAGRSLQLLKFRTMYLDYCRGADYGGDDAEVQFAQLLVDPLRRAEFESTFKFRDDPRVTRVGRLLRRTSVDELPQLWNVLCGDISLVGPRALTAEELDRYYGAAVPTLLQIRPGVTGYWQINGRSQLAYEDRVRLDLAYIAGWSLGLDLAILTRTLRVVFGLRSAY